jgi:hypothetical protein
MLRTALFAFLTLATLGCAGPDPDPVGSECTTAKCDSSEVSDDYFRQFLYQLDESSPMPFRYLSATNQWPLPERGDASIDLYLLGDGTYFLELRETNKSDARKEVVDGTWEIESSELVLAGLGRAAKLTYNGRSAINLSFDRDILGAGLQGMQLPMSMVASTGGLFHVLDAYNNGVCDTELLEYCAYGSDCGPCECGDGICQRATGDEDEDSCPADCE